MGMSIEHWTAFIFQFAIAVNGFRRSSEMNVAWSNLVAVSPISKICYGAGVVKLDIIELGSHHMMGSMWLRMYRDHSRMPTSTRDRMHNHGPYRPN